MSKMDEGIKTFSIDTR